MSQRLSLIGVVAGALLISPVAYAGHGHGGHGHHGHGHHGGKRGLKMRAMS